MTPGPTLLATSAYTTPSACNLRLPASYAFGAFHPGARRRTAAAAAGQRGGSPAPYHVLLSCYARGSARTTFSSYNRFRHGAGTNQHSIARSHSRPVWAPEARQSQQRWQQHYCYAHYQRGPWISRCKRRLSAVRLIGRLNGSTTGLDRKGRQLCALGHQRGPSGDPRRARGRPTTAPAPRPAALRALCAPRTRSMPRARLCTAAAQPPAGQRVQAASRPRSAFLPCARPSLN